ncbi:outer membrane lipid asymmetry maintenance protein MlaD [Pararhodospirillum photometricum]|uniref:Mammalian cell entry related n=1 Tax=Pararhodospirillum photometricum DSM 122 TaxID=1150469 RepID=H6SP70_PARPM|nr:outer membrane lipid asymmetry maintenance protein MlaD [Pararhodospirillum photometricum]CCG07142.1 Mammalian cell entry related [Pararhodospirillum photometricum DSM 122]
MERNPIETIMGAVVLGVAAVFLAFAYTTADLRPVAGYPVQAIFLKIGGLEAGSDVRINGVKVGTVTGRRLDPTTYQAIVDLSLSSAVRVPQDTRAAIVNDGMLGGKYIRLEPGQSPTMIAAGGRLSNTQDFQSMEELVGEIIFLATQAPASGSEDRHRTRTP